MRAFMTARQFKERAGELLVPTHREAYGYPNDIYSYLDDMFLNFDYVENVMDEMMLVAKGSCSLFIMELMNGLRGKRLLTIRLNYLDGRHFEERFDVASTRGTTLYDVSDKLRSVPVRTHVLRLIQLIFAFEWAHRNPARREYFNYHFSYHSEHPGNYHAGVYRHEPIPIKSRFN